MPPSQGGPLGPVLFVVQADYLYRGPFEAVDEVLSRKGTRVTFVQFSNPIERRPASVPRGAHMLLTPIPSTLGKLALLRALLTFRRRCRRIIRETRPSAAMVGIDVSDVYVRIFVDACRGERVPLAIMAVYLAGPNLANPDPAKGIKAVRIARLALSTFGLARAVFFRGWVVGAYAKKGPIAVASNAARATLVSNGIRAERISVTGMPQHDEISKLRDSPRSSVVNSLDPAIASNPYVVYPTEMIEQIHGVPYLAELEGTLANAFSNLPSDVNVVVKMHPREPAARDVELRRRFDGPRYIIVRDLELLPLLRGALLVIGHTSTVLANAALVGTPVLAIHARPEQTPILFGSRDPAVYVESLEALPARIRLLVTDQTARRRNLARLQAWAKEEGVNVDGGAATRLAEWLMQEAVRTDP